VLIDLADRQISYSRLGHGEPLLLIMGMAGHQRLWRGDFLALLAPDFDIVTYDHRGVGESTDVAGQFTIADLADDALAVLDAVGWGSANVFGISMGGMVAQELVLRNPARVRGLVLGCTGCGGPDGSLTAPGPMRMLEAMNSGVAENAIRAGYLANLSSEWTANDAHWPDFSAIAVAERVPVPVVMRQAQAAFAHDTSARLPSVTAPTLVMAGTADDMMRYANSELIAALIPGATIRGFPGAGHLFWWERPVETADAIRTHLLS
jgi:3-oxoadipate enol-lactonase